MPRPPGRRPRPKPSSNKVAKVVLDQGERAELIQERVEQIVMEKIADVDEKKEIL